MGACFLVVSETLDGQGLLTTLLSSFIVLPRRETKHSIAFEFCRTSINCGEAARCLIDLRAVASSFSWRGSKEASNSPRISSSFSHAFSSPGRQKGLWVKTYG